MPETADPSAAFPLPPGWPAATVAEAHEIMTSPGAPFEMDTVVVDGREVRVWKHALRNLREVFQASRAFADRTFLVLDEDRVSYDGFARAVLVLAKRLQEDGVRKGDRVAIIMRNLPEWPVAFFACLLVGGIATPLNAWWTGDEIAYGLQDSGSRILLCDIERFHRVKSDVSALTALERVYVTRGYPGIVESRIDQFENVVGQPNSWGALPEEAVPDVPLEPDDAASIFYTSGTSGNPKGAVQSHRNATNIIVAAQFGAARPFVRRGEPIPPPDPHVQSAVLLSVPLFHTTGCHLNLCPTMVVGGKLVFQRRFEPVAAMKLIERERITRAGGVPTIAWQLVEHPDRAAYDFSSLQSIVYGGAPAPPELLRRVLQVFPKIVVGFGWGMTETTSVLTSNRAEDYLARPESSGPPIPVCDIKIVDEGGVELPVGEVGELLVKGPNVVRGYWKKPEADAATFVDGWLRTGDLARVDAEGFVYIVDRKKDMLIRGGENIFCIEVEDAIYEHPAIMDAAVIGLPHPSLGEEPAAVVTLKPGTDASETDLREFVAAKIAAFKVPVRIVILREQLPRNANGKIVKPELRRHFV